MQNKLYIHEKSFFIMSKPNILLIVIDSFKSDKCFGKNKTSITPNIDFLMKNGTGFPQTISSAAVSSVAMSSVFTGLFPFRTGMSTDKFQKLDSNITTYIKILKNHGYNTFATAPSITKDFGLTDDFQNLDSTYESSISLFEGLGNKIIETLTSLKSRTPWFFYIHIFDLHAPIIVPKNFSEEKFGESKYEKVVSAIDYWIGKIIKKIDLKNTLVILTADHGDYIPIIEFGKEKIDLEASDNQAKMDYALWKIGKKVVPDKLKPLKKKISHFIRDSRIKSNKQKMNDLNLSPYQKRVMLENRTTSTSGGHRLYDDLIKVPLIFCGINIPSNKKIIQQIRHVDIFPTIEDIIPLPKQNDIDGKSLLPLIDGKKIKENPAYCESPPGIKKGVKKTIGIRTSRYKMLKEVKSGNVIELYDLINDPLEEENLVSSNPELIKQMESDLKKIMSNKKITIPENKVDLEKIERELAKLGYD